MENEFSLEDDMEYLYDELDLFDEYMANPVSSEDDVVEEILQQEEPVTTQPPEEDSIYIECAEIREQILDTEHDTVVYPHIYIEGVSTVEEALFFAQPSAILNNNVYPVYITIEGRYKQIGVIELSVTKLLALRKLGSYKVEVVKNEKARSLFDLDDCSYFYNLISLSHPVYLDHIQYVADYLQDSAEKEVASV